MNKLLKLAVFMPLLSLMLPAAAFAEGERPITDQSTYTVTVYKFIDGHPATSREDSANGMTFHMKSHMYGTGDATSTSGTFDLGPAVGDNENSYQFTTSPMKPGSYYQASEVATSSQNSGLPLYRCTVKGNTILEGYTSGDSYEQAANMKPTLDVPGFKKIGHDGVIIVWNRHCLPQPMPLTTEYSSTTTSADLTEIDWNPVPDPYGTVGYYYEVASSVKTNLNPDGSFTSTVYQSSLLPTAMIATPGTPPGIYYWHVKAVDDKGNMSLWSPVRRIKVL
jgi:hypothetical protein